MTYLEAWREGHAAGLVLAVKIINKLCDTNFETPADIVVFIKKVKQEQA